MQKISSTKTTGAKSYAESLAAANWHILVDWLVISENVSAFELFHSHFHNFHLVLQLVRHVTLK